MSGHHPWSSLKHKTRRLEFTVHLETPPETTRDDDVLDAFNEAINGDARALGPSALLDNRLGTISSTFQVEADSLNEAEELGIEIFTGAVAAAGVADARARPRIRSPLRGTGGRLARRTGLDLSPQNVRAASRTSTPAGILRPAPRRTPAAEGSPRR